MAENVRAQRARQVLDVEIAALRAQLDAAKRRRSGRPEASDIANKSTNPMPLAGDTQHDVAQQPYGSSSVGTLDDDQQGAIDLVTSRIQHLEDIRAWMKTGKDLLPLIAKVAGDVEGQYMRKSLAINVLLSTLFLIAGWLLSVIATPSNLLGLFQSLTHH